MKNFITQEEKEISSEFEKYGYIIKDVEDQKSLDHIRDIYVSSAKKIVSKKTNYNNEDFLNYFHKIVKAKELNSLRLKIINNANNNLKLRELYYQISKKWLDYLIGNEVAMQLRVNLSIQYPKDNSSLLPLHSDVWSGDSPFETVVWIPLVDCYKTKAMYILPPNKYEKIKTLFNNKKNNSAEKIFIKIRKDLKWLKVNYGQILIFNQCLPHGNIVNKEKETRWSLNCRFKSIFTPYSDKKIGEFFEPVSLKKVSELALKFKSIFE